MADLDPAHVEAVGKVAAEALIFGDVVPDDVERHRIRDLLNAQAEAILTSTDPAVHAALLAALVRAGMLEEERESATLRMFGGKVVMSKARARYVTRWEDVDA